MLRLIKDRLLKRRVLGICVKDDLQEMVGLVVSHQQGNIGVVEYLQGYDRIKDYVEKVGGLSIVMSVDHSSVLWQLSPTNINDDSEAISLFDDVVPSGHPEEFLIEYQASVIGMVRKTFFEELLDQLEAISKYVIAISISPVAEVPLAVYRHQSGQEDSTGGSYRFSFEGDAIVDVQPDREEAFDIGEESIPEGYVSAFVPILAYLNGTSTQVNNEFVDKREEEYLFSRVLDLSLRPVLGLFLLLFLGNAFLFFTVDSKHTELKEQSMYVQQLNQQLQEISKYIEEKEPAISRFRAGAQFSRLCDQVGASTPQEIVLSRLTIHPASSERGKQEFEVGKMVIEGIAQGGTAFQRWLTHLREQTWTTGVANTVYQQQPTGRGSTFQLIIDVKEAQ